MEFDPCERSVNPFINYAQVVAHRAPPERRFGKLISFQKAMDEPRGACVLHGVLFGIWDRIRQYKSARRTSYVVRSSDIGSSQ